MLKKILILLCLCLIPINFVSAEDVILGHAYFWNNNDGYKLVGIYDSQNNKKTAIDKVSNNKSDNEPMKYYETENVPAWGLDNTSTCICYACNYMRNHPTDVVNEDEWRPARDRSVGILVNLLEAYGKSSVPWPQFSYEAGDGYNKYTLSSELGHDYSQYTNIRAIGGEEIYCNNEAKMMVWNIIGTKKNQNINVIVNIEGEGSVKLNGNEVQDEGNNDIPKGSVCDITFHPAEGWELKEVKDNNNPNVYNFSDPSYKIFPQADHRIDVTFEPKEPTKYVIKLNYHEESQGKAYISEDYNSIIDESKTEMEDYIEKGEWRYIHFAPNSGYKVKAVKEGDREVHYNFDEPYGIQVNGDRVIDIYFERKGSGFPTSGDDDYKITLDYDKNQGTAYISKESSTFAVDNPKKEEIKIPEGANRYIHIIPNSSYTINSVVDKDSNKNTNEYTYTGIAYPIENIKENHIVSIDFTSGSITTGTDHNIEILYAQGLEAGTACISTSPTECMSPEVTNENVSSGVVRYIHFHPASGYKLVNVNDTGKDGAHAFTNPTSPEVYGTGTITGDRDIVVYYEKEIVPPTIITIDGNPFEHRLTALNVINPSSVSNPNIYEPGDDLELKMNIAYAENVKLDTDRSILNGDKNWSGNTPSTLITDYNPILNLSTTGDYDGHNGKVGYNKIDITALYPSSIHRALQSIYISPNWYIGTTGEGSDPDTKPDDSKSSIPGNDDNSALKIVSVRDLRWQNIVNNYKPKWGLSTANKNKPLLNPYNVTLGGSTVDISKLKTGYAVEFTFDITEAFYKYSDLHNIQIDVDFAKNGKMIDEKDESKLLQYRESYGAAPKTLDSYYRAFNLNNDAHNSKFLVTETERNSDGGATYKFVYYVPSTLFVNDGTTLKADDRLDIYFNISARLGSTEYFSYNKLASKLYGWNGWVFSYDLTRSNLEDLGYNAN